MGKITYKTIRLKAETYNDLVAGKAQAAKAGITLTLDGVIVRLAQEGEMWRTGAEHLNDKLMEFGRDHVDIVNAALQTLGMDVAAKAEAVRRIEAGEPDPYAVDHVSHWQALTDEQRAGFIAAARVRVEATTGTNPLALTQSLPQAEAWLAEHMPSGMAADNAEANQRIRATATALKMPSVQDALRDKQREIDL